MVWRLFLCFLFRLGFWLLGESLELIICRRMLFGWKHLRSTLLWLHYAREVIVLTILPFEWWRSDLIARLMRRFYGLTVLLQKIAIWGFSTLSWMAFSLQAQNLRMLLLFNWILNLCRSFWSSLLLAWNLILLKNRDLTCLVIPYERVALREQIVLVEKRR